MQRTLRSSGTLPGRKAPRYFLTLVSVAALWLSCQTAANAVPTPQQPLEAAAAREVKSRHPAGCLAAWPIKQTLEGSLIGLVVGGAPAENPPLHPEAFLFLLMNAPISVCASPANGYPAYEDVTRVKIISLSLSDFQYVMHSWGADEIRITSTLNTAQTFEQEPGPVIFDAGSLKFCWRSVSSDTHGNWQCLNGDAWFQRLPGPHLQ